MSSRTNDTQISCLCIEIYILCVIRLCVRKWMSSHHFHIKAMDKYQRRKLLKWVASQFMLCVKYQKLNTSSSLTTYIHSSFTCCLFLYSSQSWPAPIPLALEKKSLFILLAHFTFLSFREFSCHKNKLNFCVFDTL